MYRGPAIYTLMHAVMMKLFEQGVRALSDADRECVCESKRHKTNGGSLDGTKAFELLSTPSEKKIQDENAPQCFMDRREKMEKKNKQTGPSNGDGYQTSMLHRHGRICSS